MTPNNLIILGAGRSGTSLVAGLFSNAGYHFGDKLLKATINNPKGYFEDRDINFFNDKLIGRVVSKRPPFLGRYIMRTTPILGQRWLSKVDKPQKIKANKKDVKFIENILKRSPYCLKDPRFSYTLNVWKPYLRNVKYICVFRNPEEVIASTIRFNKNSGDSKTLILSEIDVLEVWERMYKNILSNLALESEDWLFLDFNDLITSNDLRWISRFSGSKVSSNFVSTDLYRNKAGAESKHIAEKPIPVAVNKLYDLLQKRALEDKNKYS